MSNDHHDDFAGKLQGPSLSAASLQVTGRLSAAPNPLVF